MNALIFRRLRSVRKAARASGWLAASALSGLLCACQAGRDKSVSPLDAASPSSPADAEPSLFNPDEPFGRPSLCDRPRLDAVQDIFCQERPTPVRSLRQLSARLSLMTLPDSVDDEQAEALPVDPNEQIDGVVYMGYSTALAGQLVSPINPRAILLGQEAFVAFQRGIQHAEIIAVDREDGGLNFYLLNFAQACNERPDGCTPGDLFTQKIERDWLDVVVRDAEDLKNTPLDCRACHQRAIERPILLMREQRGPWTHFFAGGLNEDYQPTEEVLGRDLTHDFLAAKRGEAYAGLPSFVPAHTAGGTLQLRVTTAQPLNFESEVVAYELNKQRVAGLPERSAYWDSIYAAFKRGERLAPPYFLGRATDPQKQAALTETYVRYRAGELDADELPDLSDIYPDDPQVRAEIGLQTEPDADGPDLLIQACGTCHNDVLDQSLSRARFNIALGRMSREERELAVARVELPSQSARAMPPLGNRQLDAAGRSRLVDYLKQDTRPAEDDARLEHAATVGMASDPESAMGTL